MDPTLIVIAVLVAALLAWWATDTVRTLRREAGVVARSRAWRLVFAGLALAGIVLVVWLRSRLR
ncbi:MAG: hypothetical protein IPM29_07465 [Planctomycetes bacterium]|nr:hypothetical protein [Planctomycetota bacterium]